MNETNPKTESHAPSVTIGRYLLHRQIARGGMATIHIARLIGDEGFSRIVAAKRLHPEFAEDAEFVAMFLDEARIASKVHHRNVVPVLDVVTTGEEVVLVQEYVHGAPLHGLLRTAHQAKTHVPLDVAISIGCQVLAGLQAAHDTADEMGAPLGIVHRDVSPQNIMVAVDGTARLLDFGVAKATMTAHVTREGTFKGKLAYSAPEHVRGSATQQSDIYSLSVVLWELIVGHRMHGTAQAEAELVAEIMAGNLPTITQALESERDWIGAYRWIQLEAIEPILLKGLAVETEDRWQTAAEMEEALAEVLAPASASDVASWLKALGKDFLEGRDRMIAAEEASWRKTARSVPRRMTPPSAELRVVRTPSEPPQPLGGSTAGIALLGGLAAAIVVAIVFLVKDSRASSEPRIPPVAGSVASALLRTPAQPPPPTVEAGSVSIEPPAPAAAEPVRPPASANAATVVRANRIVRVVRVVPRPVPAPRPQPAVAPAPVPAAAPPPPSPTLQPPVTDCNPPYYFEGPKKLFKPACL